MEFCCSKLKVVIEYGSTLGLITENNLNHNKKYRTFGTELYTTQNHELKIGQVWLINDELGEFEGEPFKYCPFCGKSFNNE